jgi:hypothetical protein
VSELFLNPFALRGKSNFRSELFAELMSAYKHPILNEILKRAPKSYKYAEFIDEHIRANQAKTTSKTNREGIGRPRVQAAERANPSSRPQTANNSEQKATGVPSGQQVQLRFSGLIEEVSPRGKDFAKSLNHARKDLAPTLLTLRQLTESTPTVTHKSTELPFLNR